MKKGLIYLENGEVSRLYVFASGKEANLLEPSFHPPATLKRPGIAINLFNEHDDLDGRDVLVLFGPRNEVK